MAIVEIIRNASERELAEAVDWTARNLHVPEMYVTETVAVAYVQRHFHVGVLTAWDGFVGNLGEGRS